MRVSSCLKRPWFWVCTIVLVVGVAAFALSDSVRYVIIMTIASVTYGITTAGDVDKAAALEKAVVNKTTAIHQFGRDSATRRVARPLVSIQGRKRYSLSRQRLSYMRSRIEPSRIKLLPGWKL